jgi:coatomer subunit gamma
MRTLSEVAAKHPVSVAKCNDDMEGIVADPNRSIATLAITTLLKTGSEASIDRLMKQISTFMNEIGDEFKIVVVKAIRELCIKYPQKHQTLVRFLATFLREEGGYEFKKSIVDSVIELMSLIPDTEESSLLHLCEFIEDCEFDELIVQILHLIATAGPKTASPSRYIRFVFNRVILENSVVRAAAVSTLSTFAVRVPDLCQSILILIKRSLADEDDEVRDRAILAVKALEASADMNGVKFLLDEQLPLSFASLERSVKAFSTHPPHSSNQITFSTLPVVEETYVPPANVNKVKKAKQATEAVPEAVDPAAAVYKVPEFAHYGRAFRSSAEVALTETEMEYVVTCVKHIFEAHIVLQFSVLNTIDDQRLRDVRVEVDTSDSETYTIEKVVPAAIARYGEASNCFVSFARASDTIEAVTFPCGLHFKVVQVNPTTGEVEGDEKGYDEEYPLENLEISTRDFMAKVQVGDFRKSWEQMGTDGEVLEKFGLPFKKIEEAVTAVIDYLGMQPADGTGTIPPGEDSKKVHSLHLSGVFIGNVQVLVRAMLNLDEKVGIVLKIAVRSADPDISRLVADCIN